MPLTPDDVLRYLDAHGIAARTYSHPPVHTVAESKALRGDIPGAHTKNLFLRDDKKTYFLVTLDESKTPVDLKELRTKIGARGRLSFASAEALYEHLGVRPGAVSLLALVNDTTHIVRVVLDADLLSAAMVNCHPLTNDKTTALTPEQVRAFLETTGHAPLSIPMDAAAASA